MKKFLLCALLIALILTLAASFTTRTRADGGPWPTPTPTLIPGFYIDTPFPPPTSPYYPPAFIQNEAPTLPVLSEATVEPIPTPTSAPSRLSSYLCWPFAIAFILIVIIASTALIGRRS